VVVDSWTDHSKRIVKIGEGKERFALNVCDGYIDRVKVRGMVVENAKEVVIVVEKVLIFLCNLWRRRCGGMR